MSSRPSASRNTSAALPLVLLSAGHFFIDLYSSAMGAWQPLLVERFGLSLAQAGVLGGVMVFSSSVMQPVYGILFDRFRSRMLAALAPAVAALFISSLGFAGSYFWLAAMVALGGAGIAAFHPAASSQVTEGVRENRGGWMAMFISAGTLGMALGPTFFTTIFSRVGAAGAWCAAIPGVLVSLLLVAFLAPGGSGIARSRGVDFAALRRVSKPLTILYFLVFIRSIIQITYAQFLPLCLHRERGYSLPDASYTLTLWLAAGALGGFLGGHLSDRFGGRSVIRFSMIASVPFLTLFFLTSGPLSLFGLAMGGLILLFTIPVNVVMAQELLPGQAGTVS
ncbi:MAG: MFS transporter, partial [Acidobacteria bacterium]|nr:MFS transporter [Acidobacteriota bacterium]